MSYRVNELRNGLINNRDLCTAVCFEKDMTLSILIRLDYFVGEKYDWKYSPFRRKHCNTLFFSWNDILPLHDNYQCVCVFQPLVDLQSMYRLIHCLQQRYKSYGRYCQTHIQAGPMWIHQFVGGVLLYFKKFPVES